jgi:uncharacterized membrane protein
MDRLWTEQELAKLPSKNGFRMRGEEMTRLETFCDAAFAFAVTMLVISIDGIPKSYGELIEALKGIPAFAASFATITSYWVAHRKWSRQYGLEDWASTLISLILVFVMLVFVYPLKMMFSALFAWISNNWLPTEFVFGDDFVPELLGLFRIYGLGFMALTGMIAVLYIRALKASGRLLLSEYERISTHGEIASFLVLCATGLVSAIFASVFPPRTAIFAGFVYATLPVTMPLISIAYERKAKRVAGGV